MKGKKGQLPDFGIVVIHQVVGPLNGGRGKCKRRLKSVAPETRLSQIGPCPVVPFLFQFHRLPDPDHMVIRSLVSVWNSGSPNQITSLVNQLNRTAQNPFRMLIRHQCSSCPHRSRTDPFPSLNRGIPGLCLNQLTGIGYRGRLTHGNNPECLLFQQAGNLSKSVALFNRRLHPEIAKKLSNDFCIAYDGACF